MKNIEFKVNDTKLIITVDLAKVQGPSKSGKTLVIASTEGNVTPPAGDASVRVGLNVYKYPGA